MDDPNVTKSINSGDFVESFARGIEVLRVFGPDRRELTLTEVATLCGMQRSASRRFLLTLCRLGYAVQAGRLFSLTPKVLELGYAFLSALRIPELIQPILAGVTSQVEESCSASILDGPDVIYIARSAAPRRIMSIALGVGARLPAHATSMGQALLARLPPEALDAYLANARLEALTARTITDAASLRARLDQVRAQGYALVDEELEDGLRSIAVAIVPAHTHAAFAINVSANASRTGPAEMRARFLPALRQAAETFHGRSA